MGRSTVASLLVLGFATLVVVRIPAQASEQGLAAAPGLAAADSQTFADVPPSHPYYAEIEWLYQNGYSAGCAVDPLRYCPDATMNRAESAVFVERGVHNASYEPATPTSQIFADLALDSWAAKWVNGLWQDEYTAGCGTNPLIYCPWQGHTRAEGCVFYLRMLNGATYEPPQPTVQTFGDVPLDSWYARWVEAAYEGGLIPACQTSDHMRFCPDDPLTRGLAAYMMVRAKSPHGRVFYVSPNGSDTNPGTQDQPWKTIQEATDTMVAGDTVVIQNGIYNEYVDLTGSAGTQGNSGNEKQGYISYIGESRDGVVIDGTGLAWSSGFMSGAPARGKRVVNYIKISNMTIQNFLGDGVEFYADRSDGVYPRTASHNIILDNLKVHDNDMGGIMFCGGEEPDTGHDFIVRNSEVFNNHGDHHGIKMSGDPRGISNGEHIHDSLVENNLVYNNDRLGIHNSSGNYNILIRNNIVHDNGLQGIAGHQVWNSVYERNTTYSNGRLDASAGEGIVIWRSRNITITGNTIYDNPGYGIMVSSDLGDGNPADPVITNNAIYGNLGGVQFSAPVDDGVIYNNTIASNTRVGLFFYGATTGNIVKNNILYQNQNPSQLWDSSGNTYDYNLYYPNISFPARGPHDVTGDPLFIEPSIGNPGERNYRLSIGSPAIDHGIDIGITNDLDGSLRPEGAGFDIGAYEYSGATPSTPVALTFNPPVSQPLLTPAPWP